MPHPDETIPDYADPNVELTKEQYDLLLINPAEFENLTPEERKRIEEQTLAAEADQGIIDQDQATEDQWEKSYRETRGLADAISSRTIPSPRDPETGERRMLTAEEAELAKYIRSLSPLDAAPSLNFKQISGLGQQNLGLLDAPQQPASLRPRLDDTVRTYGDAAYFEPTFGPSQKDFLEAKKIKELAFARGAGELDGVFRLGFDPTAEVVPHVGAAALDSDGITPSAESAAVVDEALALQKIETARKKQQTEAEVLKALSTMIGKPEEEPTGKLAGLFKLFQKPSFQRLVGTGLTAALGGPTRGRAVAQFTEHMDKRAERELLAAKERRESLEFRQDLQQKKIENRLALQTYMHTAEEAVPGITDSPAFRAQMIRNGINPDLVDFKGPQYILNDDNLKIMSVPYGTKGAANFATAEAGQKAGLERRKELTKITYIKDTLDYMKESGVDLSPDQIDDLTSVLLGIKEPEKANQYSIKVTEAGDVVVANSATGTLKIHKNILNPYGSAMTDGQMSMSDAKGFSLVQTGMLNIRKLQAMIRTSGVRDIVLKADLFNVYPDAEALMANIQDKIGRIRSGGAITKDEEGSFKIMMAMDLNQIFLGSNEDAIQALRDLDDEFLLIARSMRPNWNFHSNAIVKRQNAGVWNESSFGNTGLSMSEEGKKSKGPGGIVGKGNRTTARML